MADSNNTLKLLIDLGFVGADQAQAAQKALDGIKQNTGDLTEHLPEGAAMWKKYKDVLSETGQEGLSMREKIEGIRHSLGALGPEFEEVGHLAHFLFNPLTAGAVLAIAGLEDLSKYVQKAQQQYHDLQAEAQKVNDSLHDLIASQPKAIDNWIKLNEEMVKYKENARDAKFATDQLIETQRAFDENTAKNAMDFEKPALNRKVITDEIANTRAAFNQDMSHAGNLESASRASQEANDRREYLKRQVDELPAAISAALANASNAEGKARASSYVPEKGELYKLADDQRADAKSLQTILDKATADLPGAINDAAHAEENVTAIKDNNKAIIELNQKIVELSNKLAVFDDDQRKKGGSAFQSIFQTDEVNSILNTGDGSGMTIGKLAGALKLSREQTIAFAREVIDGHMSIYEALAELRSELAYMKQRQNLPVGQ